MMDLSEALPMTTATRGGFFFLVVFLITDPFGKIRRGAGPPPYKDGLYRKRLFRLHGGKGFGGDVAAIVNPFPGDLSDGFISALYRGL